MQEDPRLRQDRVRVTRRDIYQKRPVLSATIHPDIKRTLVAISERTGMTVSQVTDEVLYTGLIEMQELDAPVQDLLPKVPCFLHKVVGLNESEGAIL